MVSRLEKLARASFKGVEFGVRTENRRGGQRVILHPYPNSRHQFVEELGEIPPKFKVDAFVHGDDFIQRADRLRSALSEGGAGELVLPTLGTITVHALPFEENAVQTAVGEITFRLEFEVGRPQPGPSQSEATIEDVFDQSDAARSAGQAALEDVFVPPTGYFNKAVAGYDMLQAVKATVENTAGLVTSEVRGLIETQANLLTVTRASLLVAPADLAASLMRGTATSPGLWQQISQGLTSTTDVFDSVIRMVNFGSTLSTQLADLLAGGDAIVAALPSGSDFDTTIPAWDEDTAARTRRTQARRRIVETIRLGALLAAYERAAEADYKVQDDITATQARLAAAYQAVMFGNTDDVDAVTAQTNVRLAVQDVRQSVFELLSRKRLLLPGLTTVAVNSDRSALLTAFDLYAESITDGDALVDEALDLRALNPAFPAMSLRGEIRAFEVEA